jgi:predicted nucleic acid-binding protein
VISYVDTSLLLKLYIEEPDSHLAFQWLEPKSIRPLISTLSEVEMSSALHRAAPRRRGLNESLLGPAYLQFRTDFVAKRYQVVAMRDSTFELARSYGERYGVSLHLRALDILHVAAAMEGGAEAFGTSTTGRGGWRRRWG